MPDYPTTPVDERDDAREGTANDRRTPAEIAADEKILTELRAYFTYDTDNWAAIREQGDIDVAYAANDTWTEDDRRLRGTRPMLNLDQLSQYRNQVENTVRQNKRGVKVSQAGGGATEKTAELRSNRIREIEYQSHAQEAYSQAFSDCLTRSYGFARIVAEYEDEATDNQVFRAKAIPNPNQVLPDSDAESTSGRDWTRCFFVRSVSHAEFRRDWPTATVQSFTTEHLTLPGGWVTADRVQIAEYWTVHETPNPRGRGKPTREVCMYLTNGVELLARDGQPKKHPWKGKYIPFAACYGRIVYKRDEKLMLSYIRFARDAAKGYNWTKSTLLEKIALPVKASLMGYRGQASDAALALIERASQEHIAWIEFNATTHDTGDQVLPLPQYGTREPDIQADLLAAEGFQRDIQNALGHFNASDARMGQAKVTSGVALQELKRAGDLGSYDFLDHYDDFQKFMGEQYDDLLQYYDDTEKEVAVRLPDGSPQMQTINQMTGRAPDGTPAFGPDDLPMRVGRHTITISTGPSFDSQREAGKEAAMALLQNPQAFPIIASDAVKLMDLGPIGDQMAKDLEFIQPPAMQQARQQQGGKDGQPPDPARLQQENAQLKQRLQQAEQVLKQMDGELKGKQAEFQSKETITGMQLAADKDLQLQLQGMKDATTIAVAHINAAAKGAALDAHAAEEAQALGHQQQQADRARAHERGMAGLAQQHAQDAGQQQLAQHAALADQRHQQALEAGQQGQAHALEQGQQQAELAPPPPDPGVV